MAIIVAMHQTRLEFVNTFFRKVHLRGCRKSGTIQLIFEAAMTGFGMHFDKQTEVLFRSDGQR